MGSSGGILGERYAKEQADDGEASPEQLKKFLKVRRQIYDASRPEESGSRPRRGPRFSKKTGK